MSRSSPFTPTTDHSQQESDPALESLGSLLNAQRLGDWAWVLGYTAIMTSLSILRYQSWLAKGYDLGLYEQDLWLIIHRGLSAISSYSGQPIFQTGHAYILVLIAPLYAVGGVGAILALQAFAMGSGYIILQRLAQSCGISSLHARKIAVLYLLFPVLLGNNLFDFHPLALFVPAALGLLLAALERRTWLYAALLVVILSTGEGTFLVMIAVGVTWLIGRRYTLGLLTLMGTLLWVAVVDPHAVGVWVSDARAWIGWVEHAKLQASTFGWTKALRSWEYLAWILGPVTGFAAFWRRLPISKYWLPVAMIVAQNLSAHSLATTSPFTPTSVMVIPFAFMAIVDSERQMRASSRHPGPGWLLALPAVLFVLAFVAQQYRVDWAAIPANTPALDGAVAAIPSSVPVVTSNLLAAHLADRAYELPLEQVGTAGFAPGTYVVIDTQANPSDITWEKRLTRPGLVKLIFHQQGVDVFHVLTSVRVDGAPSS